MYLLLNQFQANSDAELLKLYVAITRARMLLNIHYYATSLMEKLVSPYASKVIDHKKYEEPEEIALQLTHKDVWLNNFKRYKREILGLQSGTPLTFIEGGLGAIISGKIIPVVRFSKSFSEKLQALYTKGYLPTRTDIRFIVAWKGGDDTEETAVLLPNVYLKLNS